MKILSETITSRNNPLVKWCASLQEKKGRNEAESFFVEGFKLSSEAISFGLPISHVFIIDSKIDEFLPKIKEGLSKESYKDTVVVTLSESAFEKISTEKSPQGIITVIKYLDFFKELDIIYKEEFYFSDTDRIIILCSLRDPGNLGSVIRSAVAFGINHIVLSDDSADLYNPKTVRSAMGSLFRVKATIPHDLASFISRIRESGRRVYAAELTDNAVAISDISIRGRDVVIIGNEGHGIPKEISALCDESVYIPISENTESLNASVAAGVLMWEQSKKEM